MRRRRPEARSLALAASLLGALLLADAAELTGRASLLGLAAWPAGGDAGRELDLRPLTADQQGLRLMLEDHGDGGEWSIHLAASRQNLRGLGGMAPHSSALFRFRPLSADDVSGDGQRRTTRLAASVDRAAYQWRAGQVSLSLGRQPVDWGSGRFWQPLNVFGAFAPTDLDTDFKPGIDAVVLSAFPSAFSSLTAVIALAPEGDPDLSNSAALHYRRGVGETAALTLLGGRVLGDEVAGASIEDDWRGIGWRVEGLHRRDETRGEGSWFWIAGLDYQFEGGTLVAAEWHRNGRGAATSAALPGLLAGRLVAYGLQPQLGRQLLGLSAQRDLSPLWRGSYLLLASALKDTAGSRRASFLHQLSLVRSLGNESDLTLSFVLGTGPGSDGQGRPQSEFGQQPLAATLRWRSYF